MRLADFKGSFEFPTIDLDKFSSFFDKPIDKEPADGSTEIEGGEFTKLVHECPKCGHKFARD